MNQLTRKFGYGYSIGIHSYWHQTLIALYPLKEDQYMFRDIWKVILDIDFTI